MKAIILLTKLKRNFEVDKYIAEKIQKINLFFSQHNLDSCVIGISGGIDSAVTYKLLLAAAKEPNSPLKKILGLLMPIYSNGTTNQTIATERGLKVVELSATSTYYVHDLSSTLDQYCATLTKDFLPNSWSLGQLASIVRTPNLYFHAALLQQQGFKSIVVGTTNRDEGAYIGFFGKASDAMVDLQPIADAHKSEIIQIAKKLDVPEEIIAAIPAGDVWDGRVDEEMIGAPYWFVEMYQLMKDFNISIDESLKEQDRHLFKLYAAAIEACHKKNAHKYQVGNPAHFIDVQQRITPQGWN
ncbi:MAG: NAD(+) synthase [Pseudomonadota bacterium]